MTIFGPAWNDLTVADIKAFLHGAPAEPLYWEAKGEFRADSVRKQVCGFANGHDIGYLLLGVREAHDGSWMFDGATFRNEPPDQITNCIADGGVVPFPDGLDVRSFDAGDGKHVAVVRIPPVATPPCNTGGTVYERVSGKTVPVTDPMRLATLFGRGEEARRGAAATAGKAAREVLLRGRAHVPANVQFAVGLAAVGYAGNVRTGIFTSQFDVRMQSSIRTLLTSEDPLVGPSGPVYIREGAQDMVLLRTEAAHQLGDSWIVRASWDGGVGIHWTMSVSRTDTTTVLARLQQAWACADEIMWSMDAAGPRYLHIIEAGGAFHPNVDLPPGHSYPGSPPPHVTRGPLVAGVDASVLTSIGRELLRATGQIAHEDEELNPGAL